MFHKDPDTRRLQVTMTASLADVVEILGRVNHNGRVWAHRVPLVNDEGEVVNILSQVRAPLSIALLSVRNAIILLAG